MEKILTLTKASTQEIKTASLRTAYKSQGKELPKDATALQALNGLEEKDIDVNHAYKKALNESKQTTEKDKVKISRQEYAILRQAVIQKNVSQKGKVKPVNYAYTAENFYVYETRGYDNFSVLKQIEIEGNEELINIYLKFIDRSKK